MPEPDHHVDRSREDTVGDIAIVLHSHMPYVEGHGTYPFGEEWLFDAVIRSYLPVMEVARDLTVTVSPVLADQLADEGVAHRLREFLLSYRIAAAEADVAEVPAECRPAAEAEAARYRHALDLLDSSGADPLAPFRRAGAEGRVALAASAATHPVLPLVASDRMRRLQVDAGVRSHQRRFGWSGGFWLPECAYEPGLEALLAERGARWFCVDRSGQGEGIEALSPVATDAGPVAFTLDWEAIQWLWSWEGYPSDPAYVQFEGKSLRGTRIWQIGGGAYDPGAAAGATSRQAAGFADDVAARLRSYRDSTGRRGLMTFAIDTELLGHWWSEGPAWLSEVLEALPRAGVRLVDLDTAAGEAEPRSVELAASTWGEGKDLRTWDSREVSDLAWASRRLELRLLAALDDGLRGAAAERAVRELLVVQSSDWAFLDGRGQAGDYAFERAVSHARSCLEAIESAAAPGPGALRGLAPDLDLAPLLEP